MRRAPEARPTELVPIGIVAALYAPLLPRGAGPTIAWWVLWVAVPVVAYLLGQRLWRRAPSREPAGRAGR